MYKEERMAAGLGVALVIGLIYVFRFIPKGSLVYRWYFILPVFGVILYVILMVQIRQVKKENAKIKELTLQKEKQELKKKYYEENQVLFTEYIALQEQLKQEIKYLKQRAEQKDYTSIQEYVSKMGEKISHRQFIQTGNESFDIVLNQKLSQAQKEGCTLRLSVQKITLYSIRELDIMRLFSNLLDNAIAAASMTDQKMILFSVQKKGNYLVVETENAFREVKQKKDGTFLSTKEDSTMHGMGLKIMEQIAKNYQGEMVVEAKEHRFHVKVMMEDRKNDDSKIVE